MAFHLTETKLSETNLVSFLSTQRRVWGCKHIPSNEPQPQEIHPQDWIYRTQAQTLFLWLTADVKIWTGPSPWWNSISWSKPALERQYVHELHHLLALSQKERQSLPIQTTWWEDLRLLSWRGERESSPENMFSV